MIMLESSYGGAKGGEICQGGQKSVRPPPSSCATALIEIKLIQQIFQDILADKGWCDVTRLEKHQNYWLCKVADLPKNCRHVR